MIIIIAITWPGFYLSPVTASLVYGPPSWEVIRVPASCAAARSHQTGISWVSQGKRALGWDIRVSTPVVPQPGIFCSEERVQQTFPAGRPPSINRGPLEVDTVGPSCQLPQPEVGCWVGGFPCIHQSSRPALYLILPLLPWPRLFPPHPCAEIPLPCFLPRLATGAETSFKADHIPSIYVSLDSFQTLLHPYVFWPYQKLLSKAGLILLPSLHTYKEIVSQRGEWLGQR